MRKKPLEICCYVAGAGAFGVFFRWMQTMLAFNELGLVDKSAFNVMVPLFVLAAAVVFYRFIEAEKKAGGVISTEFNRALRNEEKIFALIRWTLGGVMCIGGALLIIASETDKLAPMLRLLGGMAILSGLGYPRMLSDANREKPAPVLQCLYSFAPVFLFAVWLIYSYRANSINSVVWAYVLEIAMTSLAMDAFFRIAGFAYGSAKPWRALYTSMLGAVLCFMSLADSRYLGMQLILFGAGALLVLTVWILYSNIGPETQEEQKEDDELENDGFERLNH